MIKKICTKCETEYPATTEYFHVGKGYKDGLHSWCKQCCKECMKSYYQTEIGKTVRNESKEKYRQTKEGREHEKRYQEKYYQTRNGFNRSQRTRWKRYGITSDDYNRMFEEQKGCCAICGAHQSGLKHSLHVDHDHETDKVRGLLCRECNLGLGVFKDDTDSLARAIVYLKGAY